MHEDPATVITVRAEARRAVEAALRRRDLPPRWADWKEKDWIDAAEAVPDEGAALVLARGAMTGFGAVVAAAAFFACGCGRLESLSSGFGGSGFFSSTDFSVGGGSAGAGRMPARRSTPG